jgi:hypothetical protein
MVNLEDSTLGEEDSGFHIGDISVASGTLDSMDDVDEEATNQEHLHITSNKNFEDDAVGEEGSCLHIGEIGGGTAADSVDDDDEEATTPEHLHITSGNNQMSNLEEDTLGEEISCFHIGDIVTGKTLYSNDGGGGVASLTAAITPTAANNRSDDKKKWIMIGALVIATSLTLAIGGVIIAELRNEQKWSTSKITSFDAESELPWWVCLTKESCVDQAKLLGYTDKDIRYGDYSYNQIYGCFNNEGVIYWGIGGTDAQNFSKEFSGTYERLWCYGVNPNPNKEIDNDCDSAIVQPSLSSSPSSSSSSSSVTNIAGLSK